MSNSAIELKAEDFFRNGELFYIHKYASDSGPLYDMHKHDFIEVVYVISGSARHYIGNDVYDVCKGDVIIINYGVEHNFVPLEGEVFSNYDLLFTPEFFEIAGIGNSDFYALASSYLFFSVFPEGVKDSSSLNLIRSESDVFGDLFSKIYGEYTARRSGFVGMIRAYLIELITLIFREIDSKTTDNITHEQKNVIEHAINYMKSHYNTRMNLDDIAADLFLSKDYFRQLFKKSTGMSITDYIQNVRVEEATRLLETTDMNVAAVAEKCGFTDIKFFYKTFKKITGKTPNEYRKEKE